jgi:hypothetical protein
MNIKLFKKLIKDVVIEAIHDELPELINEALKKHDRKLINENISFNSSDVPIGASTNVKEQLSNRLAKEFGFPQQRQQSLKVIDAVSDSGEKVNPYLEFLVDAANNMTPQERSGLKNLG